MAFKLNVDEPNGKDRFMTEPLPHTNKLCYERLDGNRMRVRHSQCGRSEVADGYDEVVELAEEIIEYCS